MTIENEEFNKTLYERGLNVSMGVLNSRPNIVEEYMIDMRGIKTKRLEDDSTKIDIEIMTENPNMYVNLKELVERFIEIDKYYNHELWNLDQILTNIRICGAKEFK